MSQAPVKIYLIDTVNGNDANPGTVNQPWKTDVPWLSVLAGTYDQGVWKDRSGTSRNLSTITSNNAWDTWTDDYDSGQIVLYNGTLLLLNAPSSNPLIMSSNWVMTGVEVVPLGASTGFITPNKVIPNTETWTQQTTPNTSVYRSTGTVYKMTQIYEGSGRDTSKPYQMVQAASLALAIPMVQALAGSYYPDPVGGTVIVHMLNGASPSGQTLEYVPNWAASLLSRLLDFQGDGRAYGLVIDGGCGRDPTISINLAQIKGATAVGAREYSGILAVEGITASRCGSHTFSMTGNATSGCGYFKNNIAMLGSPQWAGILDWSHRVFFTSSAGPGTIRITWRGDQDVQAVSNDKAVGGSNLNWTGGSNVPYISMSSHSGGSQPFARIRLIGGKYSGNTGASSVDTARLDVTDCICNGGCDLGATINTFTATTPRSGNTPASGRIGYFVPLCSGTVTVTGADIIPRPESESIAVYAGSLKSMQGTVAFNGCFLAFMGASGFSGTWSRAGQTNLTLNGNLITCVDVNNGSLILQTLTPASGDTLSLVNNTIVAHPKCGCIGAYAGGGKKTFTDVINGASGISGSGNTFDGVLFKIDPAISTYWQDVNLTIPAVNEGDPVLAVTDARAPTYAPKSYIYRRYDPLGTFATLHFNGGVKEVRFPATPGGQALLYTDASQNYPGIGSGVPVVQGAQDMAFAYTVTSRGSSTTQFLFDTYYAGHAGLDSTTAGVDSNHKPFWYTGSLQGEAGTVIPVNTKHNIIFALKADLTAIFYTDGASDGTFAYSTPTSPMTAIPGHSLAGICQVDFRAEQVLTYQPNSSQAATIAAAMA
jgi:hypothetical protein